MRERKFPAKFNSGDARGARLHSDLRSAKYRDPEHSYRAVSGLSSEEMDISSIIKKRKKPNIKVVYRCFAFSLILSVLLSYVVKTGYFEVKYNVVNGAGLGDVWPLAGSRERGS